METTKQSICIYSKKAIWGFSVLCSPIFGGVLLRSNLKQVEKNSEGNIVLLLSILMTMGVMFIMELINTLGSSTSSLTLPLNMIGGAVLSEYLFKKHLGEDNYEHKKIWKPLLISVVITLSVLALVLMSMIHR
ncbi:hypothetical protein [Flammeovirga sp. SJP92]|uniref:hypothetical protein n=1 Tax=Flammeovirga sp. SJP92 TaxID=1775430 RepID=UPI000789378E|nr:hypothetical protein [Flammeovirga sp. SJP92]KXX69781.1 hypothetical protein AVL50_12895 [Flammeovirga sp. SJP92]